MTDNGVVQLVSTGGGSVESRRLTMAEWADRRGVSKKTVQRWLAAGEIPDAVMVGNRWEIPEHAQRVEQVTTRAAGEVLAERATSTDLVTEDDGPMPVTLREALDTLPAFLPVDVAARLLGIPREQVREHAELFEALPIGRRGSLVVPAAVVRRFAGV